jgi:hypothetical protein
MNDHAFSLFYRNWRSHRLTDCLEILESQGFCGSSALLVLGMISIINQGEV